MQTNVDNHSGSGTISPEDWETAVFYMKAKSQVGSGCRTEEHVVLANGAEMDELFAYLRDRELGLYRPRGGRPRSGSRSPGEGVRSRREH